MLCPTSWVHFRTCPLTLSSSDSLTMNNGMKIVSKYNHNRITDTSLLFKRVQSRETYMAKNNRIEWVDTAKGIAMILIILEHTTCIDSTYIGVLFTQITLPVFFALSGYFFKSSTSFKSFIFSKISSLVIPTLFFFWGACFIYWMMQIMGVQFVIPFNWIYILDIFYPSEKIYCNGVVWFLIALFWVNCSYYIINNYLSKKYQILTVAIFGLGGGIIACLEYQFAIFP